MSNEEIISKAASKLDDLFESLNYDLAELGEDQRNSVEYAMNSIQVAIGHLDEARAAEG